jgi:hypothetical protein
VESRVKAAAFEELVDEEIVVSGAVAQQAREVAVAEAAKHLQLGMELAIAVAAAWST